MNKTEIIHKMYQRLEKKIPMKDLDNLVEVMLSVISEALKNGEEVQLSEFGTFSLAKSSIRPLTKAVNRKR